MIDLRKPSVVLVLWCGSRGGNTALRGTWSTAPQKRLVPYTGAQMYFNMLSCPKNNHPYHPTHHGMGHGQDISIPDKTARGSSAPEQDKVSAAATGSPGQGEAALRRTSHPLPWQPAAPAAPVMHKRERCATLKSHLPWRQNERRRQQGEPHSCRCWLKPSVQCKPCPCRTSSASHHFRGVSFAHHWPHFLCFVRSGRRKSLFFSIYL